MKIGILEIGSKNYSIAVRTIANKLNNTPGYGEFQACGLVVKPNISLEILANKVEAGNHREFV